MIGGQTKTPTLSVLFDKKTDYVGGAGIVAKHLNETDANVFTSVIGNDELGKFALEDLKKHKINSNFIIDDTRPTTNKNLFIAENHRLLKVDTLDNGTILKCKINTKRYKREREREREREGGGGGGGFSYYYYYY